MKTVYEMKVNHLDALADHVENRLYARPELRHLFLELTLRCNEHCFHCGSNCDYTGSEGLKLEDYRRILDEVREDFDLSKMMLCITGGEPLLRKDFFEIMSYAHENGFRWGMTSNATLITPEVAEKLVDTGMRTISVSIDGTEETHDALRGMKGGYRKAMEGIQNLIDADRFEAIQITTVINHEISMNWMSCLKS